MISIRSQSAIRDPQWSRSASTCGWMSPACSGRGPRPRRRARTGRSKSIGSPASLTGCCVSATTPHRIARSAGCRSSSLRELADRHIAKTEARQLFDDRHPPPSPEEVEARRVERTVPGGRGRRRHYPTGARGGRLRALKGKF